ncbi:hypothetical protein [Levilactobacillus brevis]
MNTIFHITVPACEPLREYLFEDLLNRIEEEPALPLQLSLIIRKIYEYEYNDENGLFKIMSDNQKHQIVESVIDALGNIRSMVIIKSLISQPNDTVYEIRLNNEYKKPRIFFSTLLKPENGWEEAKLNKGILMCYGLIKDESMGADEANEKTDYLGQCTCDLTNEVYEKNYNEDAIQGYGIQEFGSVSNG